MRTADKYGLPRSSPRSTPRSVWRRIRDVQQRIAATDDDPERYEAMGVEFVSATPGSPARTTVAVDGDAARGALHPAVHRQPPAVPPIDGLAEAGFLTSENVCRARDAPRAAS